MTTIAPTIDQRIARRNNSASPDGRLFNSRYATLASNTIDYWMLPDDPNLTEADVIRAIESAPVLEDASLQIYIHVPFCAQRCRFCAFSGGNSVGFTVFIQRADARGEDSSRLFTRRMLVLLAIGIAHAALIWFGDILSLYAVTGLTLLLFRRTTDRNLLCWATGLLLMPIVVNAVWLIARAATSTARTPPTDPGHGPAPCSDTSPAAPTAKCSPPTGRFSSSDGGSPCTPADSPRCWACS